MFDLLRLMMRGDREVFSPRNISPLPVIRPPFSLPPVEPEVPYISLLPPTVQPQIGGITCRDGLQIIITFHL